jgi:Xaa-Pro aminopeptidase
MSAVLKPAVAPSRMRDPISTAELERRWAATRAAMKSAGLDALVVQSKEDWMNGYSRWFTDQPATNAYPRSVLFPLEGLMSAVDVGDFGKEMVLDGTDPMQRGVGRRTFVPSFNGAVDYNGKYDAELMAAEIRRGGHRRVGLVCPNGMYHGFVEGLKESLRDVKFENASDLVDNIKAIKSAEEIEILRRTAAMQDELFTKLLGHIRPGMKEYEISAWIQYEGQMRGSCQGLYFCTAATKPPFIPMNRYHQSKTIEKGDSVFVLIENNGPGGMYTELARVITMGRAPQALKDSLVANKAAQDYDIAMFKPGAKCSEVFAIHNEYMKAHGSTDEKRILSHGQGYEMVERPLIRHDENMVIRENMHLAIHPQGGVQLIDNYIIGKNGPGECLHRTPKEIFEIL